MTAYALLTEKQTFFDANSNELIGGKLFVYLAGTTTKTTSYTETNGLSANSNPILLNSRGEVPNGLYVNGGVTYKLVLAPSTDTDPPTSPIWTRDNLSAYNDISTPSAVSEWITSTFTPSFSNGTTFTVSGNAIDTYQVRRRVRATIGSGNIYGRIDASTYDGFTTTTVVVTWDSGALDGTLTAVDYSLLSGANQAVPVPITVLIRTSADNQTTITATTDTRTSSTTAQPSATYTNTTADANAAVFAFAKSRAGLVTSSSDAIALIEGYGRDTSNVSRKATEYRLWQPAAAAASSVPGAHSWYTTNNSGTFAERVRLDSSALNVVSGQLQENSTRAFSRNGMAESGTLGLANNTTYTFAHGFGARPALFLAYLRCINAEYGYVLDDEVCLNTYAVPVSDVNVATRADATNVYCRITSSAANNLTLARYDAGSAIGITYANWRIVLRAWY